MHSRNHDQDSQESTRSQSRHAEILHLLARRQSSGHTVYGTIALALSSAALFVWGSLLRDAELEPAGHASRSYIAGLALAVVLAIMATCAICTWMIVRVIQRRTGEQDCITGYADEQQVGKITDAVLAAIREEERAKRQQEWALIAAEERQKRLATGTDQGHSPVTNISRARGSARNRG